MDIYISSSAKKNLTEAVSLAERLETNIEISRFGDLKTLDKDIEQKLDYTKNALKNFKNKISLHGLFIDLHPYSADPLIKEISRKRYRQSFEIAKAIGATTVVFHPCYNELIKHHLYDTEFYNGTIEFWQDFVRSFEQEGITAVLENTYENTPLPIIKIIEAVNSANLKMCIDTGHLSINSNMPAPQWIKEVSRHLYHMHLHNNFGDCDAHKSILLGNLNFEEIFDTIISSKATPNLVFEIFKEEQVIESIDFYQKYLSKVKI